MRAIQTWSADYHHGLDRRLALGEYGIKRPGMINAIKSNVRKPIQGQVARQVYNSILVAPSSVRNASMSENLRRALKRFPKPVGETSWCAGLFSPGLGLGVFI